MAFGLLAGYLYWYFIGCQSGSCTITSNPKNSTLYGGLMGGLIFSLFKREKKMMTFEEIINQDKPVLVDFFATWCGPCKMQAPVLEEVKQRIGDQVSIIKIDVDQNQAVAAQYQVRSVPTLIIFKNGKIVWRQAGVFPANELERLLKENL
ncbi:thioredoxin [Flavobacterium agricola]|uniref:Thioredoxin n=1 Tax=Flavobacterium agricola TaxID=2870839 RepID=A0ABY6M215_9FLAO|nr:thioredoxin [Flavobacterium agricola]